MIPHHERAQAMPTSEITPIETLPAPTIYLIDPDPTTREQFTMMCRAMECNLVLCGSVAQFVGTADLARPGCLACDLLTLKQSGCDLKAEMQRRSLGMPVLFLSELRDVDVAAEVTGRGGWTLIRKPIQVAEVDFLFVSATEIDRRNVELESLRLSTEQVLAALTPRQRGVLACVVEGMPTRTIARQYGVSTRLIELERSELLRAFGVPTTPDLTLRMGEYRVLQRVLMRNDPGHVGLRNPAMIDRRTPAESKIN